LVFKNRFAGNDPVDFHVFWATCRLGKGSNDRALLGFPLENEVPARGKVNKVKQENFLL
jgi:hypothetical protein